MDSMTAGPHPMRCETCIFHGTGENVKLCSVTDEDNPRLLTPQMMLIISLVGCASHSSAKSEREKVLDELELWLVNERNTASDEEDYIVESIFCDVLGKIAELRQQGDRK